MGGGPAEEEFEEEEEQVREHDDASPHGTNPMVRPVTLSVVGGAAIGTMASAAMGYSAMIGGYVTRQVFKPQLTFSGRGKKAPRGHF